MGVERIWLEAGNGLIGADLFGRIDWVGKCLVGLTVEKEHSGTVSDAYGMR